MIFTRISSFQLSTVFHAVAQIHNEYKTNQPTQEEKWLQLYVAKTEYINATEVIGMEKKDKPRKLTSEQKIGKCESCLKENVVVTASGFYVAFVCDDCISR